MKRKRRGRGEAWKQVSIGHVSVSIYHRDKNGYPIWEVSDYTNGLRKLRSFSDPKKAVAEAEHIAHALARGEAAAANLTGPERSAYGRAVELLHPTGVPLELAAARYAEAVKLLGGDLVLEAARYYSERNPRALPDLTVSEVANELLTTRANAGRSDRHLGDLRVRLTRFAQAFQCPIGNVTTALAQKWLDGLKGSEQTRLNFRTVANNLFEFAMARGYVRENPIAGTERPSPKTKAPEIYTPAELFAMLKVASVDFLPALAIGAFAGVRTAELRRLDWKDVNLAQGHITVAGEKAKTASRRIVPIVPALAEWLTPYARSHGPIWKLSLNEYYREAGATAKRAGTEWKDNGLRHSFASYRLATTHDAGRVALECGNSPSVVFRHYRELVTESDGKAWFAVQPEAPVNVTPLKRRNSR